MRKDDVDGFAEGMDNEVRPVAQFPGKAPVNEDRPTAGVLPAIDVAPAVAHHPRARQIKPEFARRPQHHSRRRFAEGRRRIFAAGIVAHLDPGGRKQVAEPGVDRLDRRPRLRAAPDIRLVCHDDQRVAGGLQPGATAGDAGQETELFDAAGGWGRPSRRTAAFSVPSRSRNTAGRPPGGFPELREGA